MRQRNLTESYSNLALALKELQKSADAEALYLKAIPILEQLVHGHPGLPDYRYRLGLARLNLGTTYLRQRRWKDAEGAFLAAFDLDRLADEYPKIMDTSTFALRFTSTLASPTRTSTASTRLRKLSGAPWRVMTS